MNRVWTALLLSGLMAGCSSSPIVAVKSGFDFSKLGRVALVDFTDYPGESASGTVAAEAFEPYLLQAGYSLVERNQVEKVVQEQSLGQSGIIDPKTAAALGKILGVEALVLGRVTELRHGSSSTYLKTVQNVSYQPVYQTVQFKDRDGNPRTRQEIAQYDMITTKDTLPVTYTTPAAISISAKLVSTTTGELLWTASTSREGASLFEAADQAAASVMNALKKAWPAGSARL